MKKEYYSIITEGEHDRALLQRILNKKFKFKNHDYNFSNLDDIWKTVIPKNFPVNDLKINEKVNLPAIQVKGNKEIGIFKPNSGLDDLEIFFRSIDRINNYWSNFKALSFFIDCDSKKATDRLNETIEKIKKLNIFDLSNFKIENPLEKLKYKNTNKEILIGFFGFPNNCDEGTIEDIIIETGKDEFGILYDKTKEYLEFGKSKITNTLNNGKNYSKAFIHCISSFRKPDSTNQVAISQEKWINNKSINFKVLEPLNNFLEEFIK